MRVLLWPQLSMRNYKSGKWHLEMDPNLNKDRAWANSTKWEWHWVVPNPPQWSIDSAQGIPRHVRLHGLDWAPNVQTARFDFPFVDVCNIVKRVQPHAMILEVPEHALAMRMVQEWTKTEFPIFSYVNYSPVVEGATHHKIDTFHRQVEGAMASDLLAFNTEGLREAWTLHRVAEDYVSEIRTTVWPGVYSPNEIDWWASYRNRRADPPAVFFTSRLSDPAKNRGPQFFRTLKILKGRGHSFQVWLGDPNRSATENDLSMLEGLDVTRHGCDNRAQYLRMMNEAAIVPTLWAQDLIYSIGYCDALAAGAISVVSTSGGNVAGIPVGLEPDIDDLLPAMEEALDRWADPHSRKAFQLAQGEWLMDRRSVQRNVGKMVQEVEQAAH